MTSISPGDEVTVTITGTAYSFTTGRLHVVTEARGRATFHTDDPDVKVTVLRPDRPTRSEVLRAHSGWTGLYGGSAWCDCGDKITEDMKTGDDAHAAHLDAVLTKWEED